MISTLTNWQLAQLLSKATLGCIGRAINKPAGGPAVLPLTVCTKPKCTVTFELSSSSKHTSLAASNLVCGGKGKGKCKE